MTHRPLRSYDVRERNEKLVLSIIYGARGISQSEVSQMTGLKPPTVFRIFSQLQADGVIRECTPDRPSTTSKGRKPAFYCVVPESLFTIGIDFWSGSAAVVVADFSGEAVYSESVEIPADVPAERVMTELCGLATRAVRAVGLEKAEDKVLGIGVGAPGIVDINSGTVVRYPRIRGLDGYDVGTRLEKEFGWPVHVHNNTAVLALGEYRYGAAAGYQSVMALLIRSGVGGAFLQDGRVLTNRGRTILEVGHMVLDPYGAECGAGRRGCLEGYLSENAVAAVVQERGFSDLAEIGDATAGSVEGIDDPMERADTRLTALIEVCPRLREPAERFAQAIHGLSNLLNPEAYLLVSRYGWFSEFLAGAVYRYLETDAPGLSEGAAVIIPRSYDPIRACHGAADLVMDRFFAGK